MSRPRGRWSKPCWTLRPSARRLPDRLGLRGRADCLGGGAAGTRALGVDIDPVFVTENLAAAAADPALCQRLVRVRRTALGGHFAGHRHDLLPDARTRWNCCSPKFETTLRPGTRIVSHAFTLRDWDSGANGVTRIIGSAPCICGWSDGAEGAALTPFNWNRQPRPLAPSTRCRCRAWPRRNTASAAPKTSAGTSETRTTTPNSTTGRRPSKSTTRCAARTRWSARCCKSSSCRCAARRGSAIRPATTPSTRRSPTSARTRSSTTTRWRNRGTSSCATSC